MIDSCAPSMNKYVECRLRSKDIFAEICGKMYLIAIDCRMNRIFVIVNCCHNLMTTSSDLQHPKHRTLLRKRNHFNAHNRFLLSSLCYKEHTRYSIGYQKWKTSNAKCYLHIFPVQYTYRKVVEMDRSFYYAASFHAHVKLSLLQTCTRKPNFRNLRSLGLLSFRHEAD